MNNQCMIKLSDESSERNGTNNCIYEEEDNNVEE
jgi:hypothetical protein